jgi:hypothetical protein
MTLHIVRPRGSAWVRPSGDSRTEVVHFPVLMGGLHAPSIIRGYERAVTKLIFDPYRQT